RRDKLYIFFAHELTICGSCGVVFEGRVVLRDGGVVMLKHCARCGPSESLLSPDATSYVADFLARGEVPGDSAPAHVSNRTTSPCPPPRTLLPADVVIRAGRVYFKKTCATCGPSEALVSEDAAYYVRAYGYARAGTEPLKFAGHVEHGCPTDCGTCDDHEQHTGLPIVEVTDHCNLECPICIVDNQYAHHMEPETFARIVDMLVTNEGQCESIALSGGEPTSHPRILELVDIATRDEIGRVVIITNGLRLGRDRAFAQALKAKGAYVALQLDGF